MAFTQILTKKCQIAMKREDGTPGTYTAPAATDIFLAEIQSISYEGPNYKPNYARPDFLEMDPIPGPVFVKVGFRIPIKGSGAAGTPPEWRDAIMSCGMNETVVGSTSVTYTPSSTFNSGGGYSAEGYSLSLTYLSGEGDPLQFKCEGGLSNGKLQCSVAGSEPGFLAIEYQGKYVAPAAAAVFAVSNYDTTTPPPFRNASLTTNFGGSYVPTGVAALNFDFGNTLVTPRDVSGAFGYGLTRLTRRLSTGSFDPEFVKVGTKDWYAIQRAGTTGSISMGTIGATAGNIWQFVVNRSVLETFSPTDREGMQATSIPFAASSAIAHVEGTNHPWQIVLT